jgi:hypothetical protein
MHKSKRGSREQENQTPFFTIRDYIAGPIRDQRCALVAIRRVFRRGFTCCGGWQICRCGKSQSTAMYHHREYQRSSAQLKRRKFRRRCNNSWISAMLRTDPIGFTLQPLNLPLSLPREPNTRCLSHFTLTLAVKLRRPKCPRPHLARNRLQNMALIKPTPKARLIKPAPEDSLATRLKLPKGKHRWQKSEWQIQTVNFGTCRFNSQSDQISVIERQLFVCRGLVRCAPFDRV